MDFYLKDEMRKMKKYGKFFLIATVLSAMTIVCDARVFLRWGSRAQSTMAIEASGGKMAYETSVVVNGGKGQLTVFSFDRAISEVIRQLSKIFNTDNFNYCRKTMGYALIDSGDTVLRLIVISLDDYRQTLVFKIEQSASEFKASIKPPDRHLMKTIPGYPGSEPVFFAKDENTRMSMAISKTQSAPAGVCDFFESRLISSGWRPALVAGSALHHNKTASGTGMEGISDALRGSGMAIYLKGMEICCVLVDSSEVTGENRITILHKQPGVK